MGRTSHRADTYSDREETTLDPANEKEWAALRALGHRMVDGIFDHLQGRREQPVWQRLPAKTRQAIEQEPVPRTGEGAMAAYESFLRDVLPYGIGNTHPRFWGWVMGNGTAEGVLAEMLAAGMNPNVGGFDDSATLIEEQVIRWMAGLMGMPVGTSGLLMSGGTMANLIGLAVGRHAKAGFDVRAEGLLGGPRLRVYCSSEAHSWLKKAMELMGMGRAALCVVEVDSEYRMKLEQLRQAIAADRGAGLLPLCVVATAGTVNTGATDDLPAIADLCAQENLWFHVDGAFGAPAYWSEKLRPLVRGIERADSLAFDLHKWGYMPYDIGCVLVRDAEGHKAAFATGASYLTAMERGPAAGGLRFADRGIELSRGFRALKAWMSLKARGVDAIAAAIEQNVEQARYLVSLVKACPELELAAEAPLNIVCLRYAGANDTENSEILMRLQESGIAVPSGTMLDGRFAIRVAISNHRSRRSDFDLLVDSVKQIGRDVTKTTSSAVLS
ncbi:pyridoxal phosphate-dependent decarboxylase family protein [Edaphobacter modestus]|uniref:Glutamate/tyrosine decarboxylase-like PLP-dependent enzyme n=1 Tax=Edaphobacter modestus TaxID=388466 RepID=A0A4Q7YZW3_9BACT|nr:aminotransferase class V-fold PLP-dependent enzyme [Edaphobacter modestus]RZU42783.1 glutamate/tyrosine decarboxylase-like PLP-dependent enzyme [Edaphobacter modestus]